MSHETNIFVARDCCVQFGHGPEAVFAVRNATFDIAAGEVVSIVGESGSGKTTLARVMLGLQQSSSGELLFDGKPVGDRKEHWRRVQAVFQDPFASFNQFFTVRAQLRGAFNILPTKPSREAMDGKICEALAMANIEAGAVLDKYPFELSGGQMQRLLLARVFVIRPSVLIADEPTSMIDACSRASILEALLKLRDSLGMTIIFITHDIGLAYYVSDRIFVMSKGALVEKGPAEKVITHPAHEYTKILLDSIPVIGREWLRSGDSEPLAV